MTRMAVGLLLAAAGVGLAGCRAADRNRDRYYNDRADRGGYTIEEQQRRGRERYAIPEDDFRTGPKGYIDRPTPTGR